MTTRLNSSYSMASRDAFAKLASTAVEILLTKNKKRCNLVNIINVENNPKYQKKDIDLVVHVRTPENKIKLSNIEIKGDTYPSGDISQPLGMIDEGNFFIEIISNDTKEPRTPGCFMYTESDVVYYLYVATGTLYQLKTNSVREWFKEHIGYNENWLDTNTDLEELKKNVKGLRKTSTITDDEQRVMYSTWGVKIPIQTLLNGLEEKQTKIKKVDMLLEVLEAAAQLGVVSTLMAKMPAPVKTRALALWDVYHSSDAPLEHIKNKTKIEIQPYM